MSGRTGAQIVEITPQHRARKAAGLSWPAVVLHEQGGELLQRQRLRTRDLQDAAAQRRFQHGVLDKGCDLVDVHPADGVVAVPKTTGRCDLTAVCSSTLNHVWAKASALTTVHGHRDVRRCSSTPYFTRASSSGLVADAPAMESITTSLADCSAAAMTLRLPCRSTVRGLIRPGPAKPCIARTTHLRVGHELLHAGGVADVAENTLHLFVERDRGWHEAAAEHAHSPTLRNQSVGKEAADPAGPSDDEDHGRGCVRVCCAAVSASTPCCSTGSR